MKHVITDWLLRVIPCCTYITIKSITIDGLERPCKQVIQNTSVYVEMTHRPQNYFNQIQNMPSEQIQTFLGQIRPSTMEWGSNHSPARTHSLNRFSMRFIHEILYIRGSPYHVMDQWMVLEQYLDSICLTCSLFSNQMSLH